MKPVSELLPAIIPELLKPSSLFDDEVINQEDVHYTHPVFLQCFLPTRHTAKNRDRWQVDNGRASLVIRAGELANPQKQNDFESCMVPAGPKARFVIAFVNDYIQRHNDATVDMGKSLRKAMCHMNIEVGGKNGKELQREAKNFAASEITIAKWSGVKVTHEGGRVASKMTFWLEKNPDQRTIWQPEMTVSRDYFNAMTDDDRVAPFYWPAMVALQHDTRAMDFHCWLTYRLRDGLKRPFPLSVATLHALFGRDIKERAKFWQNFKSSLDAARKWYPKARIEVKNDCIVIKDSPPLIPHRKLIRIGGTE